MEDNFDEVVAAAEAALHGGDMVSASHSAALPSSVVPSTTNYQTLASMPPQHDLQARVNELEAKVAQLQGQLKSFASLAGQLHSVSRRAEVCHRFEFFAHAGAAIVCHFCTGP